ncbi:hypothetical protein FEM48_Zijuj10G0065300 [Ziziphus jujuba var. spinosa]|uniref:Uncharacterized protein n=1 Tax=Ziziphus jujuba var. spinosa TaxID=714518 RepID=A0A978ULV3_ZIZJJ|nr:hypothetical protein FEM48_Zijuj10G0065300 [Ziziphus jujuba var. spinosa]
MGRRCGSVQTERFLEGVAEATKNNPAAYLPFGIGPRNCVWKLCYKPKQKYHFNDSSTLQLHSFSSLCPLAVSASYTSSTAWHTSDTTATVTSSRISIKLAPGSPMDGIVIRY